ncbi:MAG TPA: hypothetical protein VMG12_19345 [Polyangiaceae bacterium]|nr:hypothetical protein [Polyangiaceae bacterium]
MKTTNAGSNAGGHARRGRVGAAFALALALCAAVVGPFACRRGDDGPRGQSGSEAPAGTGGTEGPSYDETPQCPCAADGIFLRVTLLDSDGEQRRLRIEELIHGDTERAVGDELQVEDYGELPCLLGSVPVADGQQALALLRPADPSSCDGAVDAAACARSDGGVLLTPWADGLLFAQTPSGELRVHASELGSLWSDDVDACIERHGDVRQLLDNSR